MQLYRFNLPKPSEELQDLIKKVARETPMEPSAYRWHQSIQPKSINVVESKFYVHEEVARLGKLEFQHFFNVEIVPVIGIIKNTSNKPTACFPPHSDRIRCVGLNYYVELGGENIETLFYDKVDSPNDNAGGNVISYADAPKIIKTAKFISEEWYILPARQYHSVENVETIRSVLSLSYVGDVDEFINSHRDLIIETI
jgi:hypothetical protein